MEVRSGQRTSTIAQAMAHNTSTIVGDLDMLVKVLIARGDQESLKTVQAAHDHLKRAYAVLLDQFGMEVAYETMDPNGHLPHSHDENEHERTFIEEAHHDAQLARRFETR
jgi:hypothetical protein